MKLFHFVASAAHCKEGVISYIADQDNLCWYHECIRVRITDSPTHSSLVYNQTEYNVMEIANFIIVQWSCIKIYAINIHPLKCH